MPVPAPSAQRAFEPPARGVLAPLRPLMVTLAGAAVVSALLLSRYYPGLRSEGQPAEARFTDVTAESGLPAGAPTGPAAEAATTLPGAVAFLDFDGDGRPDLFYLDPPKWPWHSPAADTSPGCALYRNVGGGHFTDATAVSGLESPIMGMSIAVGDYLNEGRPDIFITGVGGNRLFHNLGHGRFEDVTDSAGVRGDDHVWSTGAVWADLFGDGRLDLVVCNYARWPRESDLRSALMAERAGISYANPSGFVSCFPTVYRNLGHGHFVDVTPSTGLETIDRQTGFPRALPLAVAAVDADGDGRLDLLFKYQSADDVLYLNQGNGTFRAWTPPPERREGVSAAVAAASGSAFAQSGATGERLSVLREAGLALVPSSDESGATCRLRNKLGVALLDYDLSGRLDVLSPEGVAESGLERPVSPTEGAAVPTLLWNGGRTWTSVPLSQTRMDAGFLARGIAVADVYGNGSLAVAVGQAFGPPRLFRNDQKTFHSWIRIDLVGTRTAKDAGGARVEVHTPRGILTQTMEPAMGFMAQSESTLTFGLGDEGRVRRIVVRWPSGRVQEIRSPVVNRRISITEPAP